MDDGGTRSEEEATSGTGDRPRRQPRRFWSLALGVVMIVGAAVGLTTSGPTPGAVATAAVCGVCAVVAFAAAIMRP